MSKAWEPHGRRILTLAFGLGVMIMAAEAGEDGMKAYAGGSVRCDIEVQRLGNRVELQGVVFANTAVRGAYELQVTKSGGGGRSNISQAGEFDAVPSSPTKLGFVQLGGDNGSYHAKLRVMWNDHQVECEKSVGG